MHELLVNVLFVLAGLHVAAALKHQFIDRDGLLQRMLPGRAAMILRALMVALALAGAATAQAGPLQADASAGKLEFSATQADAKFTGTFKRFQVVLDFDPAHPARGKLDVGVEAASIDTQDGERDEILRGPDFFSHRQIPEGGLSRHALRARGRRLARKRGADDPRRDEDSAGYVHAAARGRGDGHEGLGKPQAP